MSGLTRARRACRRSSGGPRIVPAVSIAIIGDHFMPPEVFREKIVGACGDRARTLGCFEIWGGGYARPCSRLYAETPQSGPVKRSNMTPAGRRLPWVLTADRIWGHRLIGRLHPISPVH